MDYTLVALLVGFGPFMGLVWIGMIQERKRQQDIYKRTAMLARSYAIKRGRYR
jgi:hypothetical protein